MAMRTSRVWLAGALGVSLGGAVGCAGTQVRAEKIPSAVSAQRGPTAGPPASGCCMDAAGQADPAGGRAARKGTPVPAVAQAPVDPFVAGLRAFAAGKWDDAAQQFRAATEKDPKNVRAWHNRGAVAEREQALGEAEADYQAALELEPAFVPSLLALSRTYRAQQRPADASALLEKAIATPALAHDGALLTELARAYLQKGDLARAEATCRKVLARSKDDVNALALLARVFLAQGHPRLAAVIATKASKLAPNDARLHNTLGLIALKLGRTEVALAELRKAVELDPQFAPGQLNLGALALRYRDYAAASTAFEAAASLLPKDAQVQLAYAWALDGARAADPAKASQAGAAFEKVLALRPDSTEALCGAAWAYASYREGWPKAEALLKRCQAAAGTAADERQRIAAKLQAMALAERTPPEPDGAATGVGGSGEAPAPQCASHEGAGGAPASNAPSTSEPSTEQTPGTQKSAAEVSGAQTSAVQAPATQTSVAQTPAAEGPGAPTSTEQAPAAEMPGAQMSATQAPAAQTPAAGVPGAQTSAAQTPATQTSVAQTPATEVPGAQKSVAKKPAAQTSATETPAAQAPSAAMPKRTPGEPARHAAGPEPAQPTPSSADPAGGEPEVQP